MQPDTNQEAEQTNQVTQASPLHQVTPLSKYLAMALFIILPFVGGYIGYQYAPEKIVEVEQIVEVSVPSVEEKTDMQKEKIQDANRVIFPRSQELVLELPQEWNVKKDKDVGGSISSNYYILDKEGKMVFKLVFPLREIGYEPLSDENRRTLPTEADFELDVVDRIMRDDSTTGFVHYMQGIQRDWDGDFLQDSFEIFVPFRKELYARTVEEHQSDGGFETRYKTYSEYLDEKDFIQGIIEGISTNSVDVPEFARTESMIQIPDIFYAENINWMIEGGNITVYQGDSVDIAVANVEFDIANSLRIVTNVKSESNVLDSVLAALKSVDIETDYADRDRIEVNYTSDVYSGDDIIMLR